MGKHKLNSNFTVSGCLVDYIFKKGKVKGLRLQTARGTQLIKLPKALCNGTQSLPKPGKQIQVWGQRTVDQKKGRIKLKAIAVSPVGDQHKEAKIDPCSLAQTPGSIRVCQKGSCRKRGSNVVWKHLAAALREAGLDDQVKLKPSGCMGKCKSGPNLELLPHNIRCQEVHSKQIPDLIQHYFG